MVKITVEDRNGDRQRLEFPTDIGLNLMEALKASEYDILATCGGMALCATCHVQVVAGGEYLPERSDPELDMLDTLPEIFDTSRLACQLPISDVMQNLIIKIRGEAG